MHWLSHFLGMDDLSGPFYGWWSGAGSDLSELGILATLIAHVRHINCEVHGCWHLGRHMTNAGHTVCRRHHPDGAPTASDVTTAHENAHL